MTDETVRRLQALDEEYTAAVNTAIAEDRMDLVQRLADEYPDAAAEVMEPPDWAPRGAATPSGGVTLLRFPAEDVARRDLRAAELRAGRRTAPPRTRPRSPRRCAASRSPSPAAPAPRAPAGPPRAGRRARARPPRPARHVARRERHPRLAVHHHLGQPARRRRHQRRPGRRRLQRDDPERLVAAGQHDGVGRREGGGQLVVGQVAEERHAAPHAVRPRGLDEHRRRRARARDGEPGARVRAADPGERRDEVLDPFSYSSRPNENSSGSPPGAAPARRRHPRPGRRATPSA